MKVIKNFPREQDLYSELNIIHIFSNRQGDKANSNKLTLEMIRKNLTKCESQSEIIHSSKAITKTSLDQACGDLTVISTSQTKQKQTLTKSRSNDSPKGLELNTTKESY